MSLESVLKETFGYDAFRPNQKEAIKSFLSGRDTFVMLATGNGKSICFQIPPLYLKKMLIVVSPLVSLMQDQVHALKANGIRAEFLGSHQESETAFKEAIYECKYSIVYITPEKFEGMTEHIAALYEEDMLCGVAFDECHCISEWGHDFRPAYRSVSCLKDICPAIPIMCLTATATIDCQNDIIRTLKLEDPLIVRGSFDRRNLTYAFQDKVCIESDFKCIVERKVPTIVYVSTKKQTEDIAKRIHNAFNIETMFYHGGMLPEDRKKIHEKFIRASCPFIVATVAFGMGIDKPDIRQIVNYGVPKTIEEYYQQTGRAGRDGLSSSCILFWNAGDLMLTEFYLKGITGQHRIAIENKINKMQGILRIDGCKRAYLLEYLGEKMDTCSGCDACALNSDDFPEVQLQPLGKYMRQMLTAMSQTGDMFGSKMLALVIRGSNSKKIRDYKFQNLTCHGSGNAFSEIFWKNVLKRVLKNLYL